MTVNNLVAIPMSWTDDQTLRELLRDTRELRALIASTSVIEEDYTRKIFESFTFYDDGFDRRYKVRITDYKDVRLSGDKAMLAKYWEALDKAHEEAGFVVSPGDSPTVVLRRRLRRAESSILDYVDEKYLNENFDGSTEGYRRRMLLLLETAFIATEE